MRANDQQVGGSHYARGGSSQHWDLIADAFGPGYLIGCATKYVTRWRRKGGIEDLKKAAHYCQKLFEKAVEHGWQPSDTEVDCAAFFDANVVVGVDAQIIYGIVNWGSPTDFTNAATMIEDLILDQINP